MTGSAAARCTAQQEPAKPGQRGPSLAQPGTVVALDVGATRIKGALVTEQGRRTVEVRRPTLRRDGPEAVLQQVSDVAAELMAQADGMAVLAGGVAVCGTVSTGGRVTSVNLGWDGADIGSALRGRLDIPVAVINDAHAGALGEGRYGSVQRADNYLYVSLGTGIGAAMVRDGRVDTGAHGHAGELGHVKVTSAGPLCACGAIGCLETIMSAAAIEARWQQLHGSPAPARELIRRIADGDPAADVLWREAIEALATGLLTAMSLVDPRTIVLGGGLAAAGRRLIDPLARQIQRQAGSFHVIAELRLASLGDWSGCAGAAAQAHGLAT
jgi:glucokinase